MRSDRLAIFRRKMSKGTLASLLDRHTRDYEDLMLKMSRDLILIGEKDKEVYVLHEEAEKRRNAFLLNAGNAHLKEEAPAQIKELCEKGMALCDEKIAISVDLAAMVQKKLDQINNDIAAFKKSRKMDIKQKGSKELYSWKKIRRGKSKAGSSKKSDSDTSTILYCSCRSEAFGKMIACDNSGCPIEWFHYDCVGITRAPKGEWFCDDCWVKTGKFKGSRD